MKVILVSNRAFLQQVTYAKVELLAMTQYKKLENEKEADVQYEAVMSAALNEAFKSLNTKACAKSHLFRFKSKSNRNSKHIVSEEFVWSCPLTRSHSLPDLANMQADSEDGRNDFRSRRSGISERTKDDRQIFKYALQNYSALQNASNYYLI